MSVSFRWVRTGRGRAGLARRDRPRAVFGCKSSACNAADAREARGSAMARGLTLKRQAGLLEVAVAGLAE